jgi:hypothetical protein
VLVSDRYRPPEIRQAKGWIMMSFAVSLARTRSARAIAFSALLFAASAFAQQPAATYSILSYAKGETAYAYSDKINVRESPNTGAKVVTQLMTGDAAAILDKTDVKQTLYGVSDCWYKVDFQGQQGFVWGGLLAKEVGVAQLEGKGSADRVVMQALRSYQDAVPLNVDAGALKDGLLPKLADSQRKVLLRYYRPNQYADANTLYLSVLDGAGNPIDEPDLVLPKDEVIAVEKALAGASLPNAYPREFGVSGKVTLKALSGKKALWELSYPFPRLSASTPAENLLGMKELATPTNPDERFGEDFGQPEVVIIANKGFSPPVVLLSISIPASFNSGTFHQAALYAIDAKAATLATTYCAGYKVGGEGEGIDLVFPSDKGGGKNMIIFRRTDFEGTKAFGELDWNGVRFTQLP